MSERSNFQYKTGLQKEEQAPRTGAHLEPRYNEAMTSLPLETLSQRVQQHFREQASRYGLQPGAVTVEYLLNWGGFVNANFTVSDGRRAYHLKLADAEDSLLGLERWRDLNQTLTGSYHAPPMLDWLELEGTPYAGPLFPHLDGQTADFLRQPDLHRQVIDLAAGLHANSALADWLQEEESADTCAGYFLSTYIDRFDEDLLIVVGSLPPFVPLPVLDWMQGETRHLESLADELSAFDLPADAPTHGDLWDSNVLVNPAGEWYVLDWDDLALGDPALEFSILLSPLWYAHLPQAASPSLEAVTPWLPPAARADPALMARLEVCLRASLLDKIIDSLADYVEAGFAPQETARVQAVKQRQHLEALALYQRLYAGS